METNNFNRLKSQVEAGGLTGEQLMWALQFIKICPAEDAIQRQLLQTVEQEFKKNGTYELPVGLIEMYFLLIKLCGFDLEYIRNEVIKKQVSRRDVLSFLIALYQTQYPKADFNMQDFYYQVIDTYFSDGLNLDASIVDYHLILTEFLPIDQVPVHWGEMSEDDRNIYVQRLPDSRRNCLRKAAETNPELNYMGW
ncbi:MAG: hypothetical protein OHK0017_09070 [Patescibacteria group bacterium]